MNRPRGQTCETCLCFEPAGKNGRGECRNRAPHSRYGWPRVDPGDWCAVWRPVVPVTVRGSSSLATNVLIPPSSG